jgi:hypothetical protein
LNIESKNRFCWFSLISFLISLWEHLKQQYPTFIPEAHIGLAHFVVDQLKELRAEIILASAFDICDSDWEFHLVKINLCQLYISIILLGQLIYDPFLD